MFNLRRINDTIVETAGFQDVIASLLRQMSGVQQQGKLGDPGLTKAAHILGRQADDLIHGYFTMKNAGKFTCSQEKLRDFTTEPWIPI